MSYQNRTPNSLHTICPHALYLLRLTVEAKYLQGLVRLCLSYLVALGVLGPTQPLGLGCTRIYQYSYVFWMY